jgi:hypothetical protein
MNAVLRALLPILLLFVPMYAAGMVFLFLIDQKLIMAAFVIVVLFGYGLGRMGRR